MTRSRTKKKGKWNVGLCVCVISRVKKEEMTPFIIY